VIDLHTHSTVSDGTDTPRELVALAARVPLTALAITDHDTLDHIPEATAAAIEHGLRLVPACELSRNVSPEVGGVRTEPAERAHVSRRRTTTRLVPTGGSDYHGAYKPDLRGGRGTR
jgi:predicted metal-dependent phosphoesterase TrpH